jgi:hypothetical protein
VQAGHWSDSYMKPLREQHFYLRPVLVNALRQQIITDEGRQFLGGAYANYLEYWQAAFGDKFFDMPTMVRLGTAIESGLRQYYRQTMEGRSRGLSNLTQQPPAIFQRLGNRGQTAVTLIYHDLNYDLTTNPHFQAAREVMVHRHLFAHRAGLLDDKYIAELKEVTGEDIRPELTGSGYPEEEVYWWRPLSKLNQYIEEISRFLKRLPE